MTANRLIAENIYCIFSFTLNAAFSKWLSGRHFDADLTWAIRAEPELLLQG
jgi:hypothetical protein